MASLPPERKEDPDTHIKKPGPHDVLLGRGGGANNHCGNVNFRSLVGEHKMRYLAASRVDKPKIAREVVRIWRNLSPNGRFLARVPNTGPATTRNDDAIWFDVGDRKAREKVSQCLRERTPDVLPFVKKLKDQKEAEEALDDFLAMQQRQIDAQQAYLSEQQRKLGVQAAAQQGAGGGAGGVNGINPMAAAHAMMSQMAAGGGGADAATSMNSLYSLHSLGSLGGSMMGGSVAGSLHSIGSAGMGMGNGMGMAESMRSIPESTDSMRSRGSAGMGMGVGRAPPVVNTSPQQAMMAQMQQAAMVQAIQAQAVQAAQMQAQVQEQAAAQLQAQSSPTNHQQPQPVANGTNQPTNSGSSVQRSGGGAVDINNNNSLCFHQTLRRRRLL